MKWPPQPLATVLYTCFACAFLVLLSLVIWLAPLGIYEVRRNLFFYENRNNPPCHDYASRDCFSFALEHCQPPEFYVHCHRENHSLREGMCICADGPGGVFLGQAMPVRREMEWERLHPDAGGGASH